MYFLLLKTPLKNEEGMVMVVSLMIMLILTIAGLAAINITNNETSIVRNEQLSSSEFYEAEAGISDARINYSTWLTDTFLISSEDTASSTFDSLSTDEDGNPLASIQARCIENNNGGEVTAIFNDVADEMPAASHTASPPAGSGYSVKYFEIRRYSLTATSNEGNTVVQAGVWKVFNKY